MKDKFFEIRRFLSVVFGAMLLVACGAFDTDAPALSPDGGEEQALEEESTGERVHTFETPSKSDDLQVVGDEQEGLPGDDDSQYDDESQEDGGEDEEETSSHRCIDICFKSLWCNEEGPDFEDCVQNCQVAEETGMMSENGLYCIEWADDCSDVAWCEGSVEPCTEVCGVYDQCGYFNEGIGCHQWCVAEIWAGRLDWSAQGCVTAIGRDDACPDLAGCGLQLDEY